MRATIPLLETHPYCFAEANEARVDFGGESRVGVLVAR
jgi:hypothetical protein